MKKVILLCIMLGALLWAVDPWTGTIDVGPWWVKDNAGAQQWHQYRDICVLNDSIAWVVGDTGEVWKRTDGVYVLGKLRKDETEFYDSHVKTCDFCAELVNNVRKIPRGKLEERVDLISRELAEEREFERERRVKGCLSVDDMMNYVHGRLYRKKRAYIENHIKTCEDCRENLRKIEKIEKEFGEND